MKDSVSALSIMLLPGLEGTLISSDHRYLTVPAALIIILHFPIISLLCFISALGLVESDFGEIVYRKVVADSEFLVGVTETFTLTIGLRLPLIAVYVV